MKKFLIYVAILLTAAGCKGIDYDYGDILLDNEASTLQIMKASQQSAKVPCTAKAVWTAAVSDDAKGWLNIDLLSAPAGAATINLTASRNTTGVERTGVITVNCNSSVVDFKIVQIATEGDSRPKIESVIETISGSGYSTECRLEYDYSGRIAKVTVYDYPAEVRSIISVTYGEQGRTVSISSGHYTHTAVEMTSDGYIAKMSLTDENTDKVYVSEFEYTSSQLTSESEGYYTIGDATQSITNTSRSTYAWNDDTLPSYTRTDTNEVTSTYTLSYNAYEASSTALCLNAVLMQPQPSTTSCLLGLRNVLAMIGVLGSDGTFCVEGVDSADSALSVAYTWTPLTDYEGQYPSRVVRQTSDATARNTFVFTYLNR